MYLIDCKLSIFANSLINFPNPQSSLSELLALHALTFCPKRVISFTPLSISFLASSTIDLMGLEYSAPLVYGTTQKVQNLSQPS